MTIGTWVCLWLLPNVNHAGDEPRETLSELQTRAIQALAERDAIKVDKLAHELAEKSSSGSDPGKPTYMLTAACMLIELNQSEDVNRVLLGRADFLKSNQQLEPDFELIARLLVELQPLLETSPGFYSNMQYGLFHYYLTLLNSRVDRTQPVESLAKQFEKLVGEHEVSLVEAGVLPGVAKLLNIGNWSLAAETQRGKDAEQWLTQLRPLSDSTAISPKWKAYLWNKLTQQSIDQRRYAEALEACGRFAEFAALSVDGEAQVTAAEQLAVIYLHMGDYPTARKLLTWTENYERQNIDVAQSRRWRTNMAKALEGDREYLLARQLLLEAKEQTAGVESYDTAMAVNNLAINFYLTGELAQAKKLLNESQEILKRIQANPLQLAEAFINAGWFSLAAQQPAEARAHFKDARRLILGFPDAGRKHPRYAETLACEARAAALLHEPEIAATLLREAEVLTYAKLIDDLSATGSPRDRLAILQEARVHPESIAWPGVFDTYVELAEQLAIPANEQLSVAFKWKGVLNRFKPRMTDSPLGIEREALNAQLSELYFRQVSRLQRKQLLQQIALVENQLRSLERRMASEVVVDANSLQIETPKDLGARLGPRTVFVDILQVRKYQTPQIQGSIGGASEYLAFVVDPLGTTQRLVLGDTDAIDAAIEKWLRQLRGENSQALASNSEGGARGRRLGPSSGAGLSDQSSDIAKFLQQPLLGYLGSADNVVIRSDGMCHVVPWGALPGIDGKAYWLENLTFRTVDDVTPHPPAHNDASPQLLLVGGVDYGAISDSWEPLPGTLVEAEQVLAEFSSEFPSGASRLLSAGEANEVSVLEQLQHSNFVHLATHGIYLKQDSGDAFGLTDATTLLGSCLILAEPPPGKQANQRLTAAEIREVNLANTQLVVLSACETGLGKIKAGQGFDGLASCFHAAGAKCVVSSLWEVPDRETTELMSSFYSALWREKKDPAEALRQAQLHMLHDSGLPAAAKAPNSWAAFTASFAGVGE